MTHASTDPRFARRAPLKSHASHGNVVHHNALDASLVAAPLERDDDARSREVERFFDLVAPLARAGKNGERA